MLTKFLLPIAMVTIASSALAAKRIKCAPVSNVVPADRTLDYYESFFKMNKIIPKTQLSVNYVEQFKNEFEKFPASLRAELTKAGNKIHIMQGAGVTVDPTWEPTHEKTFDGRPWSEVPGGGGSTARGYKKAPTRIVINHLYDHHGSANMFLHEHGHSLDSIRTLHGISNSSTWAELLNEEPKIQSFLNDVCGTYCTENVEEGFAELFANYHGCYESKMQMINEIPRAAEFFSRFKTTRKLSQIWNDNTGSEDDRASDVRSRLRRTFGRVLNPDQE